MNLLLLGNDDFVAPDRAIVTGRRADHIREVIRAEPGSEIRTGKIDGLMGSSTVLELSASGIQLSVRLHAPPPAPLGVHLALALPRPKVLARVLRAAASMGVKRISLINAWKVDKSYWKSPALVEESMRHNLLLGLEQAGDTVVPVITLHRFFRRWAEDELVRETAAGASAFVAHPGSGEELTPARIAGDCILIVGPEGGFLPAEVDLLVRSGARAVHGGERILRVETAVPWLLSRLAPEARGRLAERT